jgi:hypothetical protein
MNELSTRQPGWPMHLHETVSKIEKQTRECLEGCSPNQPFFAGSLVDLNAVKHIMRDSAAESFTARLEHYESLAGFARASLDDVINETVDATLSLAPWKFRGGPLYIRAVPVIREELVAELRSILATRAKGRPTSPTPQSAFRSNHTVKNSVRRNSKYLAIDEALRLISEARPKKHAEVFKLLDEREVPIASRKPFKVAGGWQKGYQLDPHGARAWLSTTWRQLGLPAFPRGPKK